MKASGSLPESDPLYAPGLKWRARSGGDVPYWIPPARDIKAGYAPKSLALDTSLTQEELAARCRHQWEDLTAWRKGAPKAVRHTIGWLIDRYEGDAFSPFQKLGARAQRSYRQFGKIIKASIGERRIDPVLEGGVLRQRITGEDARRWHMKWGEPAEAGGEPRLSRARHLIVHLRIVASYGVEIAVPGAAEFRVLLSTMRFPTTPPRDTAPTRAQVEAIAKKAEADGFRSMAIATLAQFELIERRTHIIGTWERQPDGAMQWGRGWTWGDISKDWTLRYFQTKTGKVLREFDLKTVPALLTLLQRTPMERRVGPVIICETTGAPWTERYYAKVFGKVRKAAGIPADVWSMDMRAGGATEADSIEGVTDRALQDAGGWKDPRTRDRYRRGKQRNAQNVVALRQKAREND